LKSLQAFQSYAWTYTRTSIFIDIDESNLINDRFEFLLDHLCGLVVRVPGYRSGGPGFDSRALQGGKKIVGLDRGPLSVVSTTEELLGRDSSVSGLEIREYGLRDSSR
jgi:hypothetical protein